MSQHEFFAGRWRRKATICIFGDSFQSWTDIPCRSAGGSKIEGDLSLMDILRFRLSFSSECHQRRTVQEAWRWRQAGWAHEGFFQLNSPLHSFLVFAQIVPLLGPFSSAFSSIESQLLEVYHHLTWHYEFMKNEDQYSLLEVEERVSALERARGFTNGDDSHSLNSGLFL